MAYPTAQEQQRLGLKTILDAYTPALPDAAKDVQTPSGGESGFTWFGLGVPGGGYAGDFGSALFGILSNAAGAGGTLLEWVDDDVNDTDSLAVGRAIFNGMEDLLQEAADRMADTHREKVSQDDVMAGIKDGDWGNALLFVRDQFPNAAAYLASSMVGFGIPLVVSESERTLEERMGNQGKDTGAASPLDVAASMLSAIINVAGERIPFLKFKKGLTKNNALMAAFKAAGRDLAWEAGGGGAEEILTKIGTDAELTTKGVALQSFFEALGGLGTTPVSVAGQLSQRRTAKQVKIVLEERKEEIIAKLELEKEGPGSPLSKRLRNAKIDRKIKKVREAKNLAKLNANYPVIPESEDQALEDEAAVETPPTETPVETPPTGGTPEVTVNLEPLTPEEKAAEANRVAAETERADKNKVVVEAHRVDVPKRPPPRSQPLPPEETPLPPEDTPLPPEVLPRGEEGPGRVVGEQPVEGEYETVPEQDWRTAGAESPIFGRSEENREKAVREAAARRADRATSRDARKDERTASREARAEDQRSKAAPHIDEDIDTLRGRERQRARRKGESATTEDIRLTEEARNRADEGARGEEPVIATIIPTPDGSVLTKHDISIEDAIERRKEKRRQEGRAVKGTVFIRGKGRVNLSEHEAAKEAAALERFEQERLARVEEKRKLEKEEAADIDASRKEEEKNRQAAEDRQERRDKEQAATDREDAIAQAEMDAIDLANELAEEDYTKAEMNAIKIAEAAKIKDVVARKTFYNHMDDHIADIQAAKAESASAARATAKARAGERATQPKTETDQQPEPGQADTQTDRETFETVDGITMTRDYTFSTEDVGMAKSEFNAFNTKGKGVVPDYYIDIMAEKRLAGDSFNEYESNALTWPGVSERVAEAEGIRREEASEAAPDPTREAEAGPATKPPGTKTAAPEGAPAAPKKKPTNKDKADAKRDKKAAAKQAKDAAKQAAADKKANDAAKKKAKATAPPSRAQKNRWGKWRDTDTKSTASLNGYPVAITKVAEGSYEAIYNDEPIVDEKGVGAGQNTKWVTLDAAKKAIEAKYASPQQKKKIAKDRRKSERAATWPQDREGRWSKTLGTQIAVIEKVGEKFTVRYGPGAVQEQTYATLANAQDYLERNYPKKKTKTQVGDEPVASSDRKNIYIKETTIPHLPGHTARVWEDPNPDTKKKFQLYIDGEEFTRHSSRGAAYKSISRLDEDKITSEILKIRAREAKAEGKSASASQRAQRAAAKAAGKTARQEDTVAKRSEVKNPITPHIVSRSGVWPGMFLPKAGDKSKETRATEQQAFANVTYDHHASRMIGQKGYDVSLQYKDRMPIVYFSLVGRADALTVAETINKNPLLFNRFINEQIESGRVARGAADIESKAEYNKREQAAQKAIDDHDAKSKATKKAITPADQKRLDALRKKLKDLKDEGRLEKIAIYPGTQLDPGGLSDAEVTGQSFDTALDDWIAFLEEQGVPEAALLQKLMEISTRTESDGAREQRVFFEGEKKKIVEADKTGKDYTQREGENRVYPFEDTYISRIDGAWYEVDSKGDPIDNQPPGIPPLPLGYTRVEAEAKLKDKEDISLNDQAKQAWYAALDEAGVTEIRDESLDVLDDEGNILFEGYRNEYNKETEEDISEDEVNLRKSMEEAVEKRQEITDDINDNYETLLGEERFYITDSLAHTPKSGGLSLPDIRKLAKTISSQEEGSFDFDPNDSRENYIEKILAWVDSKGDTITDVLEESQYMFDDSDSDIKQSRMRNPTKGFDTPGQASNALLLSMHNIWGKKATGRMIDTGFIQILTFDQAVKLSSRYKGKIDSETNAFVDESDGSIIFISDNIANNTNDVRGLIMHELGVHYGKRIFSGREFDQILDQVYKLSQDGDAAVEEAVDAVIKNYTNRFGFKKLGPPAIKKGLEGYTRNETNSAFWEEVLAHLIQHKSAEINPTLWNRITRAFNTFFKKILRPFDPSASAEVDVNDIINIVEYAVGRVPSASLKKYDSNVLTRLASKTRKEFLKDSLVKDKIYHTSPFEWTAPILEKGELGFHVGSLNAASDTRISLKNALDVEESSITYEGYINIKNPLVIDGDLGTWNRPDSWSTGVYNINSLGLDEDVSDALLPIINEHLKKYRDTPNKDKFSDEKSAAASAKFSAEMRGALVKLGYDSIEYTNRIEDKGSTSYILLKDGMFKSSKSMAYKGDQPSIYESRGKRIIKEVVDNTRLANKGRGLLNKTLKGIQRQIEPLMAVEGYKTLESARMLMKGEKTRTSNSARILHDVMQGAKNKKEKDAITKYMETPNASPDNLPTRKVKYAPQPTVAFGTQAKGSGVKQMSIKDAVIKAKSDIEKLGEDLVKAGALDKEQFETLRGQYLPRTYLKYLQSNKDRMGMAFLAGSMGYTKKRNKEESLMEDLLSGRIKDPAFLSSRYIAMAGGDLATINYLNFIASDPGNHGWVIPNQVIQVEGLSGTVHYFQDMSDGMRKRATILRKHDQVSDANKMEAFADKIDKAVDSHPEFKVPEGATYRKVPNTVQFGSMRGLMVHKDIWNDLTSEGVLTTDNQVLNNILRYSSKVQKTFKYTHVPMQIPAQSRNAISNFVLLNTSGTPIWRIPSVIGKAMNDILNNGKYSELARKYGIETTTFSSEELGKIDRELAMIKKDVGGWEGTWAKTQILMDTWDIFGRAYQKTEVMFKVAKMIDLIENEGYSDSDAAMEANEAMLDYGNVSPLLRTLRSMPLGSPFITFNAKALAQMGRNIKKHPISTGKYLALPFIMSQALLAQFDDDDLDEEGVDGLKAFVASYAEDNHNVFFLPYQDDNGKWVAFDMSYFLPWGAHYSLMKNLSKGEIGEAVRDIGVLGGPYEGLIGLKFNHDPWTKQEIWNESDPPMQQAQDIMMFMASYMTPPMMMPRNKAGDIAAGGGPLWKTMGWAGWVEGGIGKDGLEKYDGLDAILPWFGINLMKIGEYEMRNKAYWKQKDLQDMIKRAEKIISDPNHTPERRKELLEDYRIFITQHHLELSNWAERASKVPM